MKKSIWVFALAASLSVVSLGQARPEGVSNYPSNSSLGYKYSLMGNFDNSDPQDELLVDFGSIGVWYCNKGSWHQESGLNPDSMISVRTLGSDDEEAVFDFGTGGFWYWDGGNWTMLSGVDAQGMFAVDDDFDLNQEVQVDFGALGVWRYDWDDSSWTQLSGLDPYFGLRTDLGVAGHEEGCWSFPGVGIWTISKSAAGDTWDYSQLTGTVNTDGDCASGHFTSPAGAEDLVVDFGSLGLWLCQGTDMSWVQINAVSARQVKEVKFADGPADELLAEADGGGLYWGGWNGTGFTWTLVTNEALGPNSASLETFDRDGADGGDEEVLIPLAAGGASLFDFSAGSELSPFVNAAYYVNFVIKGDYYGMGRDSTLAIAFGANSASPGLWLYEKNSNPTLAGWKRISQTVPEIDH